MKCPHCLVAMHPDIKVFSLGNDVDEKQRLWTARRVDCPACNEPIITVVSKRGNYDTKAYPAYPRIQSRNPLPPEVKEEYAKDYQEASQILQDSPRASAAISRRCLQQLLREVAQVKHSDLAKEIQEVLDSGKLPSHLAESLDSIRNIGNFAAHPIKSTSSGDVVDVEPEEAEWTLEVLESLFDFYFVLPAKAKAKQDKLNQKLLDAGKPGMKQPPK